MRILGRTIRPRAFLYQLRVAGATLLGSLEAERRLFARLCNEPEFLEHVRPYLSEVPQASIVDRAVKVLPRDNWRWHFGRRLRGRGLELGALHNPMPVGPDAEVRYVDRQTLDDLRREYPNVAEGVVGPDIIDDAQTLAGVEAGAWDFVIASHVIEHMPNPLRAVEAWLRVLRPGGLLYLVVPDKRATFDAHRVRTTLEHLVLDYHEPSVERDFEHYVDYAVHVHRLRGDAALAEARRLRDSGFSIHYHVFLPEDVVAMLEWLSGHGVGLRIAEGPLEATDTLEFHVFVEKAGGAVAPAGGAA